MFWHKFVCPSTFGGKGYPIPGRGGGYPSQVWMVGWGGVTPARSWWWGGGVTPARSGWWGGLPHPRSGGVPQPGLDGGGVPHHRSGGYPDQVWMVGGLPHPRLGGTPARSGWWGVPGVPPWARSGWWGVLPLPPWLDGVPPPPWLNGVPLPPTTMTEWGTPHHDKMGYPSPWLDGVPPPHQHSKRVLATWRAVCLLRSRRRTFLLGHCLANQSINI